MAMSDRFGSLSQASQTAGGLGNAALQMLNTRRGRWLMVSAAMMLVFIAVLTKAPSETLSAYRNSLSHYYSQSWRSNKNSTAVSEDRIYQSPLVPSATTLEIENGNISVPNNLMKSNPAFHLVIPESEGNLDFCKFTLSSMVLNYPPPTILTFKQHYTKEQQNEKEMDKIRTMYQYLKHKRVRDEDLVLIVEGDNTLFQLTSDVMIEQYGMLVAEANQRLLETFGKDTSGKPRFRQTIFFAASKLCEEGMENEPACAAVPDSPLPPTIYGPETDIQEDGARNRPRYLSSQSIIGPAGDLRALYAAANEKIKHMNAPKGSKITVDTILSAIFGEQEFARSVNSGLSPHKHWPEWLSAYRGGPPIAPGDPSIRSGDLAITSTRNYEFAMGLDYYSTLFQTLPHAVPDEVTFLNYTDAAMLSAASHTSTLPSLPIALLRSPPPFSPLDPPTNPAPLDNLLPYILALKPLPALDALPDPATPYAALPLLTNTYLPAVPALLVLPTALVDPAHYAALRKQIYNALWWAPHARALLRRYLRYMPQGVRAAHNANVGGDWRWDERGGQGGVWVGVWGDRYLEWALEGDVCAGVEVYAFGDGKGRWLFEEGVDRGENTKRGVQRRGLEKSGVVEKTELYGETLEEYLAGF